MENNRLSLIGKGDMRSGLSIKKLALDGYEIPGQVGIKQTDVDSFGVRVVTVKFNVYDRDAIIAKKAEDEFNKIKERVYRLYNRVMLGGIEELEEVAKEMCGLTISFSRQGRINKTTLMTDIARFAFDDHPLIIWDITNTNIESAGDPILVFKGVVNDCIASD